MRFKAELMNAPEMLLIIIILNIILFWCSDLYDVIFFLKSFYVR